MLEVERENEVQLAVKFDLHSSSIRKNTSSDSDLYDELYSQNTFVAWDEGARSYQRDDFSETRGHVVVESSLGKFAAPRSGRVQVTYRLSRDQVHDVTVNEAQVILYHRVYRHAPAIATGIALVLLGFLLAAIGGVWNCASVPGLVELP